MSKAFRLKVKKVPLTGDIIYRSPNFPPFNELHLDLLENKNKLKKNAPKPLFVYTESQQNMKSSSKENFTADSKGNSDFEDDDDITLEQLEKAYNDSDAESLFSNNSESKKADIKSSNESTKKQESPKKNPTEYKQQDFDKQQQSEETEEQKEETEKSDLLFKFMVLRRQYKNIEIPEFTEHSDINEMKRIYAQIIRRVSLDSSVDSYKQYLIGGFMVMEWVSTNWLGIDLSGFSKQQIAGMNTYERLLIELGEKNYSTAGSRFPVEVRLLFMIIFNAGLFYVQKMILGGGDSGPNVFNAMFSGMSQSTPQPASTLKKRKPTMKGPTISPREVEEMVKQKPNLESDSGSDNDKII
jgi:hypothetical protein